MKRELWMTRVYLIGKLLAIEMLTNSYKKKSLDVHTATPRHKVH